MPTTVRIPPVYCPLSTAIHPSVDLIEKRAVTWIDRHLRPDRLRRTRLLESRSAEFYARCTPGGITERVEAAAEWTYLAFWFDDLYDNGTAENRLRAFVATSPHMSYVVDTPCLDIPAEPALAALRDIASRLHGWGTPPAHAGSPTRTASGSSVSRERSVTPARAGGWMWTSAPALACTPTVGPC